MLPLFLAAVTAVGCDDDAAAPDATDAASSAIINQDLQQVDRMGLPALDTAFVSASDTKNAYNLGTPATDEANFVDTFTQVIMARYGLNQVQASGLADFVLPDMLPLDDLSGFPNGRRLADDVIDIELGLIFGVFGPAVQPLQSDNVDGNDRTFSTTFPYLASPHTS